MKRSALFVVSLVLGCANDPGSDQTGQTGPTLTTVGGSTGSTGDGPETTQDGTTTFGDDTGVGPLPTDTDEECAAQTLDAEVELIPIDVILVVDTSNSMAAAIDAVEASINEDFAAILGASGIDYRVIVLGDYPPGEQLSICISAPLSGTDCVNPPAIPAVTPQYQHYDAATGSGGMLDAIVSWYSTPDVHGLAPGGYQDLLREESNKIFLVMTDGNSASQDTSLGDAFDSQLLGLTPAAFGVPGDRRYVFHSILSMTPNNPSTAPWLPTDPIQGMGGSIQQVSILTGGWRFPLSQAADFDVVFNQIAQGVVETTPVSCAFPIPEPPPGEEIDPNTIEIDYLPGGMEPATAFTQVVGPADCTATSFYITGTTVQLCPEACATVQADSAASLDVRYGCDTGFDPAG